MAVDLEALIGLAQAGYLLSGPEARRVADEIARLRARVEALEAALRPLYEYLKDEDCDEEPDSDSIGWYGDGRELPLTFGDIRRARTALEARDEE